MTFKFKSLAIAIGLTSVTAINPAYALIIDSQVQTFSVTQNQNTGGISFSDADGPGASADSSTNYEYNAIWWGSEVFGIGSDVSANNTGHSELYSRAAEGWLIHTTSDLQLSTQSRALHTVTITNDSTSAQNINFDFLIDSGYLTTTYWNYGSANSFIELGYSADIRINGASIWNSSAELRSDINGNFLNLSGAVLGDSPWGTYSTTAGDQYYYWDSLVNQLDLGVLAAGQSLTLEYDMATYINELIGPMGYSNLTRASFGDPFDFNSTPLFAQENFTTSDASNTSSVPEPASTLLLGLGLAGLAYRRKAKK